LSALSGAPVQDDRTVFTFSFIYFFVSATNCFCVSVPLLLFFQFHLFGRDASATPEQSTREYIF
jgi:hypothetical protein